MIDALAIPFPSLDPVAVELGPLSIKWYGLAYMAGLVLGWLYIRALLRNAALWPGGRAPFGEAEVDDLLIYITLGVMIGGRLGSVLFYEPSKYIADPVAVLKVWQGGMAFHGALIGCGLGAYFFARRRGVSLWSTMDVCAAAVPIGLFFGRVANFINAELFGRPTDLPWGMVFPSVAAAYPELAGLEPTPRHPSQLYEAALEGLFLFFVLRFLTHRRDAFKRPGLTIATFLLGYGCVRSFAELFRQPDPAHALTVPPLTPGIAYSIPMILLGLHFVNLVRAGRTR
jgi:phosphatidylglycerol:prolipoprotein diacylglycerol transferase